MTDPRSIVIDASAALSIVLDEPDGPAVAAAVSQWTRGGSRMVVPSHFWLEVTNALIRGQRWAGDAVLEALHHLDQLQLETVDPDRALVVLTIDISERHGLTTYDAAYLALAVALDGSLATLDVALAAAAGARALYGGSRLSEAPAAYEHAVTWPDYKGASAYLSKLRAEAARAG